MDRKKNIYKSENQGSLQLHKNIMATNSSSSIGAFIASLKFMKKTKPEVENNDLRAPSPKPSPTFRRRTHSADSIYDEVEFENFVNENCKKTKKANNKSRRKSLSRKHFTTLNNDDTLHNAVLVGNIELARQTLLSGNIDVNVVRPPGWTALHHACRIGNVELIKILAEAGANLSYVNSEGNSPLKLAVTYGHFEAATYLIHEQGVSCDEIRDGFQEKRRPSNSPYDHVFHH